MLNVNNFLKNERIAKQITKKKIRNSQRKSGRLKNHSFRGYRERLTGMDKVVHSWEDQG